MIYLSAVVQTTLSFGDLVPMTTAARIVVAIQAIFGIAIAGFFLNAAGRGAQNT
jgi:Ion channel